MPEAQSIGAQNSKVPGVCEAARQLLSARRDAVLERLDDAAHGRGERAERVHQLRVSTRRADAALEFLLEWLPGKKTAGLRKNLARLRKRTGRVRDGDVLRKLIRQSPTVHNGALKTQIKRSRKSAEKRLARTIKRLRHKDKLCRLWDKVIEGAQWQSVDDTAQEPAFLPWAEERLNFWLESLAAEMGTAIDSFERLHAYRLSCKQVRYGLELLPEDHHREASGELLNLLRELQDRMGAICDQEALRLTLEESSGKASKKDVERLTADQEAAARQEDALLGRLQADWPALQSRLNGLVKNLKS